MYNRYIPQPDGSYRRAHVQEPPANPPRPAAQQPDVRPAPAPKEDCPPPAREEAACAKGQPCQSPPPRRPGTGPRPKQPPQQQGQPSGQAAGVGSFLRQLLPKDFDTEDLLVVLLLLLMAGDNRDEQNTALLTLALYLFL